MLTTFFADPASAHRPDIRRCNTRQARGWTSRISRYVPQRCPERQGFVNCLSFKTVQASQVLGMVTTPFAPVWSSCVIP